MCETECHWKQFCVINESLLSLRFCHLLDEYRLYFEKVLKGLRSLCVATLQFVIV